MASHEFKTQVTVMPRLIDLRAIISTSIESSEGQLKQGQKIVLDLGEHPKRIVSDPKLLRHVLINLISNAAKYSSPSVDIRIKTGLRGNQCFVSVTDRGIGIPAEDQAHLFDRFFRARNVENVKGTGLGLNIVNHYVELLDGEIEFESKLGEGSTFTVLLPT